MQQIEIWGYGQQLVFIFGLTSGLFLYLFCVPIFENAAKVIKFNIDSEAQEGAVDKCCLHSFL